MADKKHKTQAQKAASAGASKKKGKKAVTPPEENPVIPARAIMAIVYLVLAIVFLVIYFKPEGAFTKLLEGVIHGIIGRTGFIVSILALIYLFIIYSFAWKRPVKMRTACVISFVLICGCIAHLIVDPACVTPISYFYSGGISGETGGILCGLIALGMRKLFGLVISFIILIVSALLTLLGAMQLTIPSIYKALVNRPKAEWEEEEASAPPAEPAAVVVNHLANKRIAYMESRRQKAEQEEQERKEREEAERIAAEKKPLSRVDDILRQIGGDVETPVAAAGAGSALNADVDVLPFLDNHSETIPEKMPPYIPPDREEPSEAEKKPEIDIPVEPDTQKPPKKVKVSAKAADTASPVSEKEKLKAVEEKQSYTFPPIDLLKRAFAGASDSTGEMREYSRMLNETLASFKIEAHIINVTRGPSVTRYEVELEKGVRLSKLTSAADDIALSLGASGVRIAAVPGKISVVGIEVPNRSVTTVSLREVIDSKEFASAKSKSSFAVGKDIGGACIVGNIAKLPHMLIAGTTGSGKSVCMNSIIISLLYKASPDDVKLIMVDPKMVELGIYNGIPHLLIPVVTDPKKAAGSLQWAVVEMMRRYKVMSDAGVRDLESYNSIVDSQETGESKLPQIVVIIDELADLMLVAAKEVEESICRIAQMGRAAGIHLVIATQRPSADVITGLMKANIPSRIAFAVASAMESRIILDTQGAEKLVGKGDMLFAPIGSGKPKRVQGCFVSDPEVEAVATYVKNNFATSYDQQVIEEIEKNAAQTGSKQSAAQSAEPNEAELDGDEMLPAAVDVILETGQASVSMLQRRLKLGYARAARIVDEMEEKGIVGPFQGSKPRAILVTKEQWASMRSGQPAQMDFSDIVVDGEEENSDPF